MLNEGRKGKCAVSANSFSVKHEVQQEGPGIEKRRSGARFQGDWLCKCKAWNKEYFFTCGRCKVKKDDCCVGEDLDDSLDPCLLTCAVLLSLTLNFTGRAALNTQKPPMLAALTG